MRIKGKWHFVACSAAAGIAVAFFHLNWKILIICALFTLLVLWLKFGFLRLVFLCFLVFFLAYSYFYLTETHNESQVPPDKTDFYGKVVSLPKLDGNHFVFRLKLSEGETVRVIDNFRKKQRIPDFKSYRYGMTCRFQGELRKPQPQGNFHGFDYSKYLHREKIHWQVAPQSLTRFSCQNAGYTLYDRLQQWRGTGIRWVEEHFPSEIHGVSGALLFGERKDMEEDVLGAYQDLGIIHLLAVSGLHVGLVVGALYFVLIRLGVTRERTLILLFFLLPLYVMMTGGAPSAVRAGSMTMVVLAALRFRRQLHPLDGISWIVLFMLALNPYALFHVGFQLSFLTSFTLLVSAPLIQKRYRTRLGQLVAISILAQIISFPIVLYHFYSISPLSLPLNLVFIPFVSFFVLPLMFITFFASILLPGLGQLLAGMLAGIMQMAHGILLWADHLPWGTIVFGKPSLLVVFLLYIVIFYGLFQWESGKGLRRLWVPVSVFLLLCVFQWGHPYLSAEGNVTMLDVGQGDSFLIELPHREAVYMIDTGGTVKFGEKKWQMRSHEFKVGRDIVLPELKALGIRNIDKLILTHGDRDHIGGTEGLLGEVRINEILYGQGEIDIPFVRKLLSRAHDHGTRITFVKEGVSWQAGGQTFTVLNPTGDGGENNARSIVIAARIGGLSWLFTGDLEKEGERRLQDDYSNLRVDVLKAGHHGSKTSSSEPFISRINPRVALISAGRHNMYGHPNDEVIERFRAHQTKIFRTDRQGAVRFHYGRGKRGFTWVLHK